MTPFPQSWPHSGLGAHVIITSVRGQHLRAQNKTPWTGRDSRDSPQVTSEGQDQFAVRPCDFPASLWSTARGGSGPFWSRSCCSHPACWGAVHGGGEGLTFLLIGSPEQMLNLGLLKGTPAYSRLLTRAVGAWKAPECLSHLRGGWMRDRRKGSIVNTLKILDHGSADRAPGEGGSVWSPKAGGEAAEDPRVWAEDAAEGSAGGAMRGLWCPQF